MGSINPHDIALHRGLTRMRRAYDGLLAVNARSLDELTPAEVALEAQWTQELEPVLSDLYWYPLRNGLNEAPEKERELRRWIREALSAGIAIAALLALLKRYQLRAVNIGGKIGLDELNLTGDFRLMNPTYLAKLDDHADMLTTAGSDMSLIDTTSNHLTAGIQTARDSSDNTLTVLGTMIAGWAAYRSVSIAITEQSRQIANGLNWTYGENEVTQQVFRTRGDDRVCPQCGGLEGRVMSVSNIPAELQVPIHTKCRCGYTPVLSGWARPASIWRGA